MAATHNTDQWQKRSVVSSFIFKSYGLKSKRVALFKRSDKVSTYKHHLAPISGSIDPTDPSPVSAAWREILEETTLTPSNLILLRRGKSYTFRDPSVKREWTIYPFMFCLRCAEDAHSISIDWEHESWDWYDANNVITDPALKGVPKLAESLRRVYFETDLGPQASPILNDGLTKLATDHESGARELAAVAVNTLHEVTASLEVLNWNLIRLAGWHLCKNGRPSMGAAITSVLLTRLSEIKGILDADHTTSMDHPRTRILSLLSPQALSTTQALSDITSSFVSYLDTYFPKASSLSILTLSSSSTILAILTSIASRYTIDLRVLESRPLFEGVSLSSSLLGPFTASRKPHKITIYPDTSPSFASAAVDMVLIGSDRVSPTGAVLNKTGSLPAILTAKHLTPTTTKTVVLTDTAKISQSNELDEVENNDPSQVFRSWQSALNTERVRKGTEDLLQKQTLAGNVQVEIINIFFEWVSGDLIDAYITEKGQWTVTDIAQRVEDLIKEEEQVFGDW
ncbi:Methylthioribose-1-phosphate isomerase [Triangularia verruculosa]|uniref:Methylthioribose-1-phosphate isomerase n=1 Tax=Triangularia verruculosa TaxID=2587418 RepID=A0AAN7AQQ7_9PEZI|nr:Methylthioribose-1-phosphate isomerase [Triangularia verruculosa]